MGEKKVKRKIIPRRKRGGAPPLVSGALGGPGAGRLAFQGDYAVWRALNSISETLATLGDTYITVEPRVISSVGVTGWDMLLEPRDESIEVKFNAIRKDVEEFLDRVGRAAKDSTVRHFTFVYNKGGNALLRSVEQLRRIAIECGKDREKFSYLVAAEEIPNTDEVLNRLGANAHLVLQSIFVEQIPESILQKNTRVIARMLAGAEADDQLARFLYDKFSHAVAERVRFSISELIDEAKRSAIIFRSPPATLSSDYDPVIPAALFLLQACVTGLPIDVIANAVGCNRSHLQHVMKALVQSGRIIEEEELWFLLSPPNKLTHRNGPDIVSRALESLLRFIETNNADEKAFAQIYNAVNLARACTATRPSSVVPVFPALDHLLKRTGDLQFILEVSQLTIDAVKRVDSRTANEAAAYARALVCGVSWAYQRMPGRLDDARNAYVDSRRIAESIDDRRTLAFISKCLGRLYRMEAEQKHLTDDARRSKLAESVKLLQSAIEQFENLQDFPLKTHQIADCYSLLGRTYLVANKPAEVGEALRKAFSKMEAIQSKEYADLRILTGDYEMQQRKYSAAKTSYDLALEVDLVNDAAASEIRARALLQQALCYLALKDLPKARKNLDAAAEIWDTLGQHESAANAQWQSICIEQNFPVQVLQLLEDEPSTVKVAFARRHMGSIRRRAAQKAHLSSRAQPDKEYWRSLIKEARRETAINMLNE